LRKTTGLKPFTERAIFLREIRRRDAVEFFFKEQHTTFFPFPEG